MGGAEDNYLGPPLLSSHLERRAAAAQVALGSCELTCESSKLWDNQIQLVSVVRKVSFVH